MRYFEILAATAYKEFAHSLSNKSLQRLKDAGLIGRIRIKQALNKLEDKYKIPYKKNSETKEYQNLGSYYNSNDGHFSPRVIVQERKMHNQTGGNFIRNNGVTWADMREAVVDDSEVLYLLEGQKRLRNRDYKRVARTAMQAKDMRDLYHKIYQTRI